MIIDKILLPNASLYKLFFKKLILIFKINNIKFRKMKKLN